MDTTPPPLQKKGLGPLAWVGIGCGGLVALVVVAAIVVFALYGGKFKQIAEDAQKNPARATASSMIALTGNKFEMAAEDDVNKRYTVREKSTGKLTTIYWNETKKAPETVPGDFSAIPTQPGDKPQPAAP